MKQYEVEREAVRSQPHATETRTDAYRAAQRAWLEADKQNTMHASVPEKHLAALLREYEAMARRLAFLEREIQKPLPLFDQEVAA